MKYGFWVIFWALMVVLGGCQPAEKVDEAGHALKLEAEAMPIGGDFTLTDQEGQSFQLSDQKHPMLLFFGYATCPDFCPQTLAQLAQVYSKLGDEAQSVMTVFVSVDPKRDTPEVLKTYLANFNLPVVGLTGAKDTIDAIVKQYGAFYEVRDEGSAAGYLIDHSLYIYVIDREGGVRYLLRSTDSIDDMVAIVKQVAQEGT